MSDQRTGVAGCTRRTARAAVTTGAADTTSTTDSWCDTGTAVGTPVPAIATRSAITAVARAHTTCPTGAASTTSAAGHTGEIYHRQPITGAGVAAAALGGDIDEVARRIHRHPLRKIANINGGSHFVSGGISNEAT